MTTKVIDLSKATNERQTDPRILFAIVSFSLLVSSMQSSMIAVALPDLIRDLNAPLRWAGWTITIFTLAQAVSMPIAGKLSDDMGRRTVLIGGMLAFALGSLACSLATNIYLLIIFRAFQGVAAGSLQPSAFGIVGEAFDDRGRSQAIGLISSIFPIGTILGPNLGGVIVDTLGWRYTFGLSAPLAAAVVVCAFFARTKPRERQHSPIDYLGAVYLSGSVGSLVFSFTELGRSDPSLELIAASLVATLLLACFFVLHEARTAHPIVDLSLLKRGEFALVNAINFFYGVIVFGLFTFVPLYAVSAYGMSSGESGLLLTPRALAMMAASIMAAMLLPKTGYKWPIVAGLTLMSLTLGVLANGTHGLAVGSFEISDFLYLSAVVAITGIAVGTIGPASNNASLELAPDKIAAITGLRGMFRAIGGSIGTALIVLVASRASSTAAGLELSFLGLAVLSLLTAGLALWLPGVHGQRQSGRLRLVQTATEPSDGE